MKKFICRLFCFFLGVKVKFTNSKTEFDYLDECVWLNLNEKERSKENFLFRKHIRTHHKWDKVDQYCITFLSLLHEVGHYHTSTSSDNIKLRIKISKKYNLTNKDYYKYFNIPCEYDATEWAITYIEKHPKISNFINFILRRR